MEEQNRDMVTTEKKINGVKYQVVVKFSENSKETLRDKLIKLIVRDYRNEEKQAKLEKKSSD